MEIVYPMFCMVVLTAIVGVLTAYIRITSSRKGEVDPRYFRLMSKYEVTDRVAKFGRNLDNLFEVPVLFYAACLCALTLQLIDQVFTVMAWLFVILRIVHTVIHLTYNNPLHRFIPFFLSFIGVISMWVRIVVSI